MLHCEAGGHRIQRVPPTERKGRVHTSTVTVAVIDPEIKSIQINESDFRIDWFSGTGAGGQHRNKHQNSCRIMHLPTGQIATAQCRSRQSSQEQARAALLKMLTGKHISVQYDVKAQDRKQQVGSGMRGDKFRTYRFQDDVVKDHNTVKSDTKHYIIIGIILSILIHLIPIIYFLFRPPEPPPPPPPPVKDLAVRLLPKPDEYKPTTLSKSGDKSSSEAMDCSQNLGNSIYIGIGILHSGGTINIITEAPETYPAYRAGLRKGDIIISLDKRLDQGYIDIVIKRETNVFYHIKTEEICYSGS